MKTYQRVTVLTVGLALVGGCPQAPAPRPVTAQKVGQQETAAVKQQPSNVVTGLGREGGSPASAPAVGPKVTVELYVMSKCPFAATAIAGIKGAFEELKGAVDLRVDYIVTENQGVLSSMHGISEVRGDILQLCAQQSYPTGTFLEFVSCQNKSFQAIPQNWEKCARQAGIDTERLGSCYISGVGEQLLRDSMRRSQAANAMGSPTIVIEGKAHNGGRDKRDFLVALCSAYPGGKQPAACGRIPPPVEVHAVVLNDKRCTACKVEGLIRNLRERFFPSLTVRYLDYGTPDGRTLYRSLGLKGLPAVLLEPGVEKAANYASISRWAVPKGDYKLLRIPASFDPTAEICDNKKDDTGNGRVDCADPTCRNKLRCRRRRPRHLEVFIMSQCPYAAAGVLAMKEVLKNFGGRLGFQINYIAEQKDDGTFSALHGQPEVEENTRQLCVKKHYPRRNRYLKYVWCRMESYRSDQWRTCAESGGLSAAVIERCASGPQGRRLLAANLKVAKDLQISASPTWLVNRRHKATGITAEQIKTAVCKHNKRLSGCQNTLSDDASIPSGSCD
jgi:hypothetical protein